MAIIPLLVFGAAAIAAASYVGKGISTQHAADLLITDFRDVLLGPITLLYTDVTVRLKITNPTKTAITVSYIYADIFLDDDNLGRIEKVNWNQTIQPNKTSYFNFDMRISNLSSGATLFSLIKNGELPDNLIVRGKLTANGFDKIILKTIPLNNA